MQGQVSNPLRVLKFRVSRKFLGALIPNWRIARQYGLSSEVLIFLIEKLCDLCVLCG
jgi:hypothetical protein